MSESAKVTKAFSGCPDGALHPRAFAPGDIVTGGLASIAIHEGWAQPVKPEGPTGRKAKD